ncbi:MAG: P1 family peptidase [Gemmatimonadaceae bacterium]
MNATTTTRNNQRVMRLMTVLSMLLPVAIAAQSATQSPALVPRVNPVGPSLTFDFPGMRIGVAEYDEGPTGTTVFYFPKKVVAVVDVRGGAPGTIFTDALRLGIRERRLDGVVFSGGSAYGLAAATGAAAALKPQRVRDGQWATAAWFAGAIIYDIAGRRLSTVTPDEALGVAALNAAVEGRFPLGPRGAGRSAMQGYFFSDSAAGRRNWPHSGEGGAFRQIGPTKIAVFTVVNASGAVVDRRGRVVRCSYAPSAEDCGTIETALTRRLSEMGASSSANSTGGESAPAGLTSNTTITLVVTNQKLEVRELQRLAIQVHMSMSRAIQPFSTTADGDALFAVTTAEVDNPSLSALDLSTIASETAWDAVLASVPPQDPVRSTTAIRVSASDLDAVVGTYEFPSGARITVTREGEQLHTTIVGSGGMFFAARGDTLIPVAAREFLIDGPRKDRVLFEPSDGRVAAMVLNPGQWGQRARRVP